MLHSHSTRGKFDHLMGSKVVEALTGRIDVAGVGHLLDAYQKLLEAADGG